MPCPTCSATMEMLFMNSERKIYHCPRCGTMRSELFGDLADTVPKLVERCRQFSTDEIDLWNEDAGIRQTWNRLGIAESINIPANRPS